jgi:hypothetical protein
MYARRQNRVIAMAVAIPWLDCFSVEEIPRATTIAKNKVIAIEIFQTNDHVSQLLNDGP